MAKKLKLSTLITDMSSEDYHGTPGTVSSSQLKTILDDPKEFYEKYVERSVPKESNASFDVGTYFHTAVLEPEKLESEVAVFKGVSRAGKEWKKFKKKHEGKLIVTPAMAQKAEKLKKAVEKSKKSMRLLSKGVPEVSLFVELLVANDEIYAKKERLKLTSNGWTKVKSVPTKGRVIVVKVRADKLRKGAYCLDLKSTSSDATAKEEVLESCSYYQYDLSAALYLDIFNAIGLGLKDWWWIFASKESHNAKPWKAKERMIKVGRAKWRRAILTLAEHLECNWNLNESEGGLDASPADVKKWLAEEF